MKELARFFESYSFPASKSMFPTNDKLWEFVLKTEGLNSKKQIIKDIKWVLQQDLNEQKEILSYVNQLAQMGPIRFKAPQELISYLEEMSRFFKKNSVI